MFKVFQADPRKKLQKVIGDFELPVFRKSTLEVLRRLRDPTSRPSHLSEVVHVDPGLTVRVLKAVNSAAYSPRRPVENLDQAVVMLGATTLEQIVMSLAVKDGLPGHGCDGFSSQRFWHTAAMRAAVAKEFADRTAPSTASDCFTGALLQDMAVPLLAHCRSRDYGPVFRHWLDGDANLDELERSEFGWDHAEVGTWMAEIWGFPPGLLGAIGGHHSAVDAQCAAPIWLASHLHETHEEEGVERVVEGAHDRLNMTKDEAAQIVADSEEKGEELAALLG